MSRAGALLAVAYPFLILGGLRVLEPRQLALAALLVLALRALLLRRAPAQTALRPLALPLALPAVPGLLLLGLAWLWNDPRCLMFVPALVSLALLFAFARTLRGGPSLVESFARLQRPELSSERVRHCREATAVWCGFFLLNAVLGAGLAAFGEPRIWALYTGVLAYVAMAGLFAGEFVVRAARFPDEPAPALLRRLLPGSHPW